MPTVFPQYPATTLAEAEDILVFSGNQIHDIVNGDAVTTVTAEDGEIPSIRKTLVDNFVFKSPLDWANGSSETVYNQLRKFTDGSWWYAPMALDTNPIPMWVTPIGNVNWKPWNKDSSAIYQGAKRLAAEAGFNMVGTFYLGGTLTTANDVLLNEQDGLTYNWKGSLPKTVSGGSTPSIAGGIGPSAWVDVTSLTFVSQLSRVIKKVTQTGQYGLSDFVSIKDYGAIGDGTLHTLQEWIDGGKFSSLAAIQLVYPKAVALSDSIDAIAIQQCQDDNQLRCIFAPAGTYMIDRTLFLKYVQGDGPLSMWRSAPTGAYSPELYEKSIGTTFLLIGTGPKVHTIDYITESRQCGFDRPNAARDFNNTYDAEFLLADFTNKDAVGTTKATLKPFSVGVVIGTGYTNDWHGYGMRNIRVIPSCAGDSEVYGIKGYADQTTVRPWSHWDIGVWCKNPYRFKIEDCQIVGYYNMRGMFTTNMAMNNDDTVLTNNGFSEFFKLFDSIIQGGLCMRSGDIWPIKSKTETTLTIQWTASHRFETSGTISTTNGTISYTGLTYSSGTSELTFTGCNTTANVIVDNTDGKRTVIRTTQNGGMANTAISGCEINDFSHNTRIAEQSPDFAPYQMNFRAAIEVSGHPTRGMTFRDTSIFGNGPMTIHFGNTRDIEFYSCYAEPKAYKTTIGGALQTAGACYVMGPRSTYFDYIPDYDRGYIESYGKAFTSYVNRMPWVNASGRYAAVTDIFNPRSYFSSQQNLAYSDTALSITGCNGKELWLRTRSEAGGSRSLAKIDKDANITIGNGFGSIGKTTLVDQRVYFTADGVNQVYENTTAGANEKCYQWYQTSSYGNLYLRTLNDDYSAGNPIITCFRTGNAINALQLDAGVVRAYCSTGELDLRGANGIGFRLRHGSSSILLGTPTDLVSYSSNVVIRPNTDGTASLCSASNRASVVYAATGTINTSDERVKTFYDQTEQEVLVARELKTAIKKFRFNDSIEVKGEENSRFHFGVGAQTVQSIFEKYNLNPDDYALFCYDEWEEIPEQKDEAGVIIRECIPAGNRYGIRYEELLCFIIANT